MENNSVIRDEATKIASKALGKDVSAAVGAIDPAIFTLIDMIAQWIIKIIQQLQERLNHDPAKVAAAMRRPSWLWQMRVRIAVRDQIPSKFKSNSAKVADELLSAGARVEEARLKAATEELGEDDLILV